MGWLWASPSPHAPPASAAKSAPPHHDESVADTTTSPTTPPRPSEPVDPELQKFLDLFRADLNDEATSTNTSASPPSPTSSPSWLSLKTNRSTTTTPPNPTPSLTPLAESLLPTDMSCRQAFDLAWACNGINGQFNSLYRYGTMRSCSNQWDDFWFCMRTKSYTGDLKANMIREHYHKRELAKYGPGKPSSEDVWTSRASAVPPGTAFVEVVPPSDISDEEWRRLELERRRQI